jgi:hypothetical protein
VATAAASLGCVAAAVLRFVSLARAGRDLRRQLGIVAAGFAAALVLIALLAEARTAIDLFGWLCVVGATATALALPALLVALLAGRKADDVGLLLPFYLLGAGLFVYPLFTLFALAVNSGGLC